MTSTMQLRIATPTQVLVDLGEVNSLRAADASGSFGLLPGHANFLTVVPPSVVQWHLSNGTLRYCAVRSGVLAMTGGDQISIACRQGVLGGALDALDSDVRSAREAESEADRRARVEQIRLHARAVRQLMPALVPGSGVQSPPVPDEEEES
ncbi:MAG: F0F1 ATP synthase subunit epsilon [Sphingomonadales bacterium]|nr:F0F1 ATP synthase subunit epsilon [Sphingomonadales bacterium]